MRRPRQNGENRAKHTAVAPPEMAACLKRCLGGCAYVKAAWRKGKPIKYICRPPIVVASTRYGPSALVERDLRPACKIVRNVAALSKWPGVDNVSQHVSHKSPKRWLTSIKLKATAKYIMPSRPSRASTPVGDRERLWPACIGMK